MENLDPGSCRHLFLLLLCLLPTLSWTNALPDADDMAVDHLVAFVDDEVRERLQSLDQGLVEHRFDPLVRSIIKRYVTENRKTAALVAGRMTTFFPLFERHLRESGMPMALKYLPIVESSLRPEALSHAGAIGLWQFMPSTAREAGLRVDEYIDERVDPNRATEAALRYLEKQYNYFGDWALALAAYNAGGGRIRGVMRRSRKKNYWDMQRYLPRETRQYVPGFIAATYLAEFYSRHDIEPVMPTLDEQLTSSIKVQQPCSFYRVAQVTGLSIDVIQALNPAYRKGYLPGYRGGHYLTLPQRVMPAFRAYLERYPNGEEAGPLPGLPIFLPGTHRGPSEENYTRHQLRLTHVDGLEAVAQQLNVSVYHLAAWNDLAPTDSLATGDLIYYFKPSSYQQLPFAEPVNQPDPLPAVCAAEVYACTAWPAELDLPASTDYLRLHLERRRKPSQVAARYPHITTEELLQLNDLPADKPLPAGTVLLVSRR